MAEITSTHSSKFHDVENKIYVAVMKLADPNWTKESWVFGPKHPLAQASKYAMDMVRVFSRVQMAYVNDELSRDGLVEWLVQLGLSPMDMSEIIEEMEDNKRMTFNVLTQRYERGTGE